MVRVNVDAMPATSDDEINELSLAGDVKLRLVHHHERYFQGKTKTFEEAQERYKAAPHHEFSIPANIEFGDL
jgi:hypothetical protein